MVLALALLAMGVTYLVGRPEPPPTAGAAVIAGHRKLSLIDTTVGERQATTDTAFVFDRNERWIVFGDGWSTPTLQGEVVGGTRLMAIRPDGGGEHVVADRPVTLAAIGSKDDTIFFTDDRQDLMAVSAEGGSPRRLTDRVAAFSLSPDGRRIIYKKLSETWRPGEYWENSPGIAAWDMAAGQEKLIDTDPDAWGFAWTPDSRRVLVMSHAANGMAAMFVMDADGSGRRQVTNVGHDWVRADSVPLPSERAAWTPEGRYLAYESDRQIWVLEFDRDYRVKQAKPIGYGKRPEWVVPGRNLRVLVGHGDDFSDTKAVRLDMDGRVTADR